MPIDWLAAQGLEHLPRYLTALAIGLLIGLERERNPTAKAGLRTCALVALAGALSAALAEAFAAPAIVAVGLGAVAFMMIAAYYHHHEASHERDPGTTTIAAVMLCFLLGAMVLAGHVRLAVILGILAAVLLYFKAELGGVARRLERRDLVSILQFAVVAFVVLPLLPDRGYGPYAALNPRHIWLMVVLISGVSLAGYVALRSASSATKPARAAHQGSATAPRLDAAPEARPRCGRALRDPGSRGHAGARRRGRAHRRGNPRRHRLHVQRFCRHRSATGVKKSAASKNPERRAQRAKALRM